MEQINVKGAKLGTVLNMVKWMAQWTLPAFVYDWLGTLLYGREYCPPAGHVRMGSLRRIAPISRIWGCDRGKPVDRYYIDRYLTDCSTDICGHVLEIGHSHYTKSYGDDRVTKSDVLHYVDGNPEATIVADLSSDNQIPSDIFDCIILTQTLHMIYDVRTTIKTLYRILKPGGVVLATFPGISHLSHEAEREWADIWFWSFTVNSAHRLFEEVFPAANVKVQAYGNVLSAIAFMNGLAAEELQQKELDYHDPDYEVLIAVRAEKPVL